MIRLRKEKLINKGYMFSSYSAGESACLGFRKNDNGTVNIVDSKTNQTLTFTTNEWNAFVKGVAAGEFE